MDAPLEATGRLAVVSSELQQRRRRRRRSTLLRQNSPGARYVGPGCLCSIRTLARRLESHNASQEGCARCAGTARQPIPVATRRAILRAVRRLGTHHLRSRQAASSSPRHRLSHGVVVWLVGCRNTRAARGTRRWSPDPWLLDLAGARWKYGIQNWLLQSNRYPSQARICGCHSATAVVDRLNSPSYAPPARQWEWRGSPAQSVSPCDRQRLPGTSAPSRQPHTSCAATHAHRRHHLARYSISINSARLRAVVTRYTDTRLPRTAPHGSLLTETLRGAVLPILYPVRSKPLPKRQHAGKQLPKDPVVNFFCTAPFGPPSVLHGTPTSYPDLGRSMGSLFFPFASGSPPTAARRGVARRASLMRSRNISICASRSMAARLE